MWRKIKHLFAREIIKEWQYESLKITATLGKNYVPGSDGAIHLDALLMKAVVDLLPDAPELDKSSPMIFPIPVEIHSVINGLPLFLSTSFMSSGVNSVEYWHKRFPSNDVIRLCKSPNTSTTRGGYKDMRIPVDTFCSDLTAFCVGDKNEIARLLNTINFIGKKRSIGKGYIVSWSVEKHEISNDEILHMRPVPSKSGRIGGWCPPYWFKPWHLPIR